jgi:beta-lactamase regulating signal transducer with metallopeptidase domain
MVRVPTVVGWLRPVILMPVGALAGLPAEQVEALLLHELAHIRRADYLVNLLQSAAEALLFYHPAVWWISGHIRAEREACCDDMAVAVTGDVLAYAQTLANLEASRTVPMRAALAANGGSLANRIARLLGHSRHVPRTFSVFEAAAAAVLLHGNRHRRLRPACCAPQV